MRIYCTIPTPEIEELGKKLGLNVSYTNNLVSVWQSINNRPNVIPTEQQLRELINNNKKEFRKPTNTGWARTAENGYEVSTRGDKRFSALVATFNKGTIIDGVDVGGRTIEDVYQSVIKKSRKGQAPSKDSKLYRAPVSSYSGDITPDTNTIFVFGSNPEGRHGAGAAKVAREKFGAVYGQGEGLQGNAYALPTKDLRIKENNSLRSIPEGQIIESIKKLYDTARQNPNKQFKIAYKNTTTASLNGYTGLEMIDMFLKAGSIPSNIVFSKEWVGTGKFNLSKKALEDFSYTEGYLPLWQEWARQNPQLMDELRVKAQGKTLTDQFANTRVSQARALSDILNSLDTIDQQISNPEEDLPEIGIPEIIVGQMQVNKESPRAKLSREMSPSEISTRENMIAKDFTKVINEALEDMLEELREQIEQEENPLNKLRLSENLNTLTDPVKGRRAVISSLGLEEILSRVKEYYQNWIDLDDSDIESALEGRSANYVRNAYQKVLDNFDLLFDEASSIIEKAENVRIVRGDNEEIQNTNTQDSTNEETLGDVEGGERINGNEGYTFKIRFVDPYDTARAETRKILSNIKQVDINGNVAEDDLGNVIYVREDYAHTALLSALNWMDNPDDFSIKDSNGNYSLPALEQAAKIYPWVSQVINELESNPDLISVFYTDFRKEYVSYWMARDNKMFPMNSEAPSESTLRGIQYNYEQGNPQDDESIFDANLNISNSNITKAELISRNTQKLLSRAYDNEDMLPVAKDIERLLKILGFNEYNLNIKALEDISNRELAFNILGQIDRALEISKDLKDGEHYTDSLKEPLGSIARLLGKVTELDAKIVFRQGKNSYPSYAAPNYIETVFKKLLSKNSEKRKKFLEEEFGKYDWFRHNGVWRNEWLRLLESDENIVDNTTLVNMFNIDGVDYENWVPTMINRAAMDAYFYTKEDSEQLYQYGMYHFPIFSDTKMMTFVKFIKYTGDYKSKLIPLYRNLVRQELSRIHLVEERAKNNIPAISNFDKEGKKFCFIPELNYIKFQYEGKNLSLLDIIKDLKRKGDVASINKYIDNAIEQTIDSLADSFIQNNIGTLNTEEFKDFIRQRTSVVSEKAILDKVREFVWNQIFASSQMVQLVTTDLAYYRDAIDFQKRFKEVYAAGTKLNTNSKYGRKIERTIYLRDKIVTSPTYTPLKVLLKEALDKEQISKMDYDSILYKFKNVNAVDGQAYRSISSYRAIMDMLGRWTPEMEKAFNRLQEREFDMSDFNIVWQTIKPFVYGQVSTPDGLGGNIKTPHQNKNSEFLLLATYQALGTALNKSPQLRGLNKFMEDHDIDVAQFESAVKVGCSGVIDLNVSPEAIKEAKKGFIEVEGKRYQMPDLKDKRLSESFDSIKEYYDNKLDNNSITQEEYNKVLNYFEPTAHEVEQILTTHILNPINETDKMEDGYNMTTVHPINYEDYMIAQPTPEHLFDVKAVFGSQFRNLIYADLPENIEISIGDKTIKGRDNVQKYYFSLIVENLLDSHKELQKDFSSIEQLQKRLLSIVKGNPKYGRDLINALEIVEVEGRKVFNIPFNDRITATRLEELIISMFRNSISKQDIKGAACILVSNFGFTEELEIKRREDGSVEYVECYLPAYSKQFYEDFLKPVESKEGKIIGYELDYNKLKKEDSNLLNFVGYRIPTEAKYSMLPLRIKGFLPQQNGSAIMLPAEVTTLSGSDFDVDKLFMILPEFKKIQTYNIYQAWTDFYNDPSNQDIVEELNANIVEGAAYKNISEEDFLELLRDSGYKKYQLSKEAQNRFSKWFNPIKKKYLIEEKFEAIKYDHSKEPKDNSREQRNNEILQLAFQILTNKDVNVDSQRPGNFDTLKRQARVNDIISDYNYSSVWMREHKISTFEDLVNSLSNASLDTLNTFMSKVKVDRNPLTTETFAYFHRQNMTGKALVGIYANNNTMQAKFQGKGLALKDGFEFEVNGRVIKSLSDIYTIENGRQVKVSKNCSEFSAASVDNVKDPVLASLMQNTKTASIGCFMLRAGMSIPEIGAFFSIPTVRDTILKDSDVNNLENRVIALESSIAQMLGTKGFKTLPLRSVTTKEIMEHTAKLRYIISLSSPEISNLDRKDLIDTLSKEARLVRTFLLIASYAKALNETVMAYRADSPNGSIQRSVALAKVQSMNIDRLIEKSLRPDYPISGIGRIIRNNYITPDMSIDTMRKKLLESNMPILQAFYSLGIDFGVKRLSDYFAYAGEYLDNIIDEVSVNSKSPLRATDVQSIYNGAIQFALSDTSMFGNSDDMSLEERREYYLTVFPKEFNKIIHDNSDIASLPFIRKLTATSKGIIMRDSSRNSQHLRDLLMNSAETLLYMDNPEAQKLAVKLFTYAYFKEGLGFGPNSFSQYFSTIFKTSFPEYIRTLRELESTLGVDSRWDRFISQVYANNRNLAYPIIIPKDYYSEDSSLVSIPFREVVNPNLAVPTPLKYIRSVNTGAIYRLDETSINREILQYSIVPEAPGNLYNINEDVDIMVENYNKYNKVGIKRKEAEKQEEKDRWNQPTEDGNPINGNSNPDINSGVVFSEELQSLEEGLSDSLDSFLESLESGEEYDPTEGFEAEGLTPCK